MMTRGTSALLMRMSGHAHVACLGAGGASARDPAGLLPAREAASGAAAGGDTGVHTGLGVRHMVVADVDVCGCGCVRMCVCGCASEMRDAGLLSLRSAWVKCMGTPPRLQGCMGTPPRLPPWLGKLQRVQTRRRHRAAVLALGAGIPPGSAAMGSSNV